jgi:hypothetical protein
MQRTLGPFLISLIGAGTADLKDVADDRPTLSLSFKAAVAAATKEAGGIGAACAAAAAAAASSSTPLAAAAVVAALQHQAAAMLDAICFPCFTGFFTVNSAVTPHTDRGDRGNSVIFWQGARTKRAGSQGTVAWFGLWSCLLALPVVSGLHLYIRSIEVVHGTSWRRDDFLTEAPTDDGGQSVLVGMVLSTRWPDFQWVEKNQPASFPRGSVGSGGSG